MSFIFQGQYKFKCPTLKDGTSQKCDAVWSYTEVRRLAVLTPEEMQYFEESIACLAAAEYCEFKKVSIMFVCTMYSKTFKELFSLKNLASYKS